MSSVRRAATRLTNVAAATLRAGEMSSTMSRSTSSPRLSASRIATLPPSECPISATGWSKRCDSQSATTSACPSRENSSVHAERP